MSVEESEEGDHQVTKDGARRLELYLLVAGVIVATGGTIAASISASLSDEALQETRAAAWEFSGSQNCTNYRTQILELARENVPEVEIRAWFAGEDGGARNPYEPRSSNATALGDLEEACGTVSDLLAILDEDRTPSQQLLERATAR